LKELHSALNVALDMKPHPSSLSVEAAQLESKNWYGRVLVAEDDLISQQVTSTMLKNMGCSEVDVVSNGIEAIEAIKTQEYALVFMDLSMPKLDGLEATKLIRNEIEGNNSLRIVGLTAHAIKGYRQKCIDAGMNDYISKPISSESLQKVLCEWMP
jgi:CheY-like chemotaxis protein